MQWKEEQGHRCSNVQSEVEGAGGRWIKNPVNREKGRGYCGGLGNVCGSVSSGAVLLSEFSSLCYVLPLASLFLHETLGFRIFNKDIAELGQPEGIIHPRAVAEGTSRKNYMSTYLPFSLYSRSAGAIAPRTSTFHPFSNTTELHYYTYHQRLSLTL